MKLPHRLRKTFSLLFATATALTLSACSGGDSGCNPEHYAPDAIGDASCTHLSTTTFTYKHQQAKFVWVFQPDGTALWHFITE